MDYLQLLEHSHKMSDEWNPSYSMSRLEFIGEAVFDFTTYEDTVLTLMAKKAIEVCQAISSRKTFDYIKSEDGHLWYLIMVNMPFFQGKLEWGTSIRGAWWDLFGDQKFAVESCFFYEGDNQILEIGFTKNQWTEFITAMAKYTASEQ